MKFKLPIIASAIVLLGTSTAMAATYHNHNVEAEKDRKVQVQKANYIKSEQVKYRLDNAKEQQMINKAKADKANKEEADRKAKEAKEAERLKQEQLKQEQAAKAAKQAEVKKAEEASQAQQAQDTQENQSNSTNTESSSSNASSANSTPAASTPAAQTPAAPAPTTDGFNFNGYHFGLSVFSGTGHVPADSNVYLWGDYANHPHYLVEILGSAGSVIQQLGVGSTVTINGRTYTIYNKVSGMPNDGSTYDALTNGNPSITIQSCDSVYENSTLTIWYAR